MLWNINCETWVKNNKIGITFLKLTDFVVIIQMKIDKVEACAIYLLNISRNENI